MRSLLFSSILLIVHCLCPQFAHTQTAGTKPPGPLPLLESERDPITSADFERLLSVLKEERTALEIEWREMFKRGKVGKSTIGDKALKEAADDIIAKLKHGLPLGPSELSPNPKDLIHPDAFKEPIGKPKDEPTTSKHDNKKTTNIGNPLNLGQTFFRAGMYSDALATLEKVELVGMKSEERAPILYFRACCHSQLGQSEKAKALFEDVIKVRGDERLVEYARWHLEELVWHRNVENTLQDIRKRLKAAEKAK